MIREDRFVQSHRPYAVDLASLSVEQTEHPDCVILTGSVRAVWFRRQDGITRACVGRLALWAPRLVRPVDVGTPAGILSAHLDGRYGGQCRSRWDGQRFWSAVQVPDVQAADLALLKPMLAAYPQIPAGYSGWWRF